MTPDALTVVVKVEAVHAQRTALVVVLNIVSWLKRN
tara:strand:+ start:685 stop:792 length:108 start_codon:yes stop_codon:yes gene_type:complete